MSNAAGWFSHSNANLKANFCPVCSSLLDIPKSGPIKCQLCNYSCTPDELETRSIVTRSKERKGTGINFKKQSDKDHAAKMSDGTVLCGKCGFHELYFKTAQLRSADEGQTIFYECARCAFTWSVNS